MFLHSSATDEICSASLVVENVQLLSALISLKESNFSVAKFFANCGKIREWKTGINCATIKLEIQKKVHTSTNASAFWTTLNQPSCVSHVLTDRQPN
jgi:hypothetical protein